MINARKEIQTFLDKGNINFPDEVVLGKALAQVYKTNPPSVVEKNTPLIDEKRVRKVINKSSAGYLSPKESIAILDAIGVPRAIEVVESDKEKILQEIRKLSFPIVMKVVGPLHKTDVKGVVLNVSSLEEAADVFDDLMMIKDSKAVLVQPMFFGIELFVGVKKEIGFNHTILCGLGGVYIEVMNDVAAGLSPLSKIEVGNMIKSLRGYDIIKGTRGELGINEELFIDVVHRISALTQIAPEIIEMDINPLIGEENKLTAVDVRIRIEK